MGYKCSISKLHCHNVVTQIHSGDAHLYDNSSRGFIISSPSHWDNRILAYGTTWASHDHKLIHSPRPTWEHPCYITFSGNIRFTEEQFTRIHQSKISEVTGSTVTDPYQPLRTHSHYPTLHNHQEFLIHWPWLLAHDSSSQAQIPDLFCEEVIR